MPNSLRRLRPAALASFVAFASLLSCGRDVTGPGAPGRLAEVALNPVFGSIRLAGTGEVKSIGSVVDFEKVRVVLLRSNGDTAVDRIVMFPPDSASVRLAISVTLSQAATRDGEIFSATLKYISSTGDTVFTGGPAQVLAAVVGSGSGEPPQIPVTYTGRGANAASLVMSPPSFTGTFNQQVTFTSVVTDAQATPITGVPVAYTSTDSARVHVNLRTGAASLIGARGSALIIGQTLTGQSDTSIVDITPTASAILLVSGGNQQARQGDAFPLPVRVRVNAVDGIGVAGVPVLFEVTRGQGTPSPATVQTDANGFAETVWTAGDSAGVGVLRASVQSGAISVTANGTQLSSAPTSLAFTAQPANFTAGDTIPPFDVLVLDATGDTVSGFAGNVTLDLNGGSAGASLLGNAVVAATNGVAKFSGLTINRGGTGFRIRATVAGVPPVLTNLFNVAAAPPTAIAVLSGANQTAPASTVLPDSVRVRVSNTFGAGVGGVTVNWTLALGGGSLSAATSVTDSLGRAAVRWTLGAAGTQQITAGVSGLQPIPISASIFVPQGQPTLFIAPEAIATTLQGVRAIPIFLTPAAGATIVATLEMRDTSIARWTVDSTVFTAGTTLRSPTLIGRASGSTYAVVTSSAGTDSVLVAVDSASVLMLGNSYNYVLAGDTLRKIVYLTEPAPPGGLTVTVVSSDTSVVLVAPGSGRGAPADECDYYCTGLRAADEPFRILAPPSDTAFVTIPEGQLAGQVVLLTHYADGQGADVTFSAPGYVSGTSNFTVYESLVYTYSVFSALSTPFAVGARNAFSGYLANPLTREVTVRMTSRNPAAVRVDSIATVPRHETYFGSIFFDGLAVDSTWIVVAPEGFAADSFFVRVAAPYVNFDAGSLVSQVGGRTSVNVFSSADSFPVSGAFYSVPGRATDLPITLTSSDPAVFVPDFTSILQRSGQQYVPVTIRGVGVGSAWLHATAPGASPDSIQVTVSGTALSAYDPYFRVGAGQVHNGMYAYLLTGTGVPVEVTATSSDPSILTVLTPQLPLRPDGYSEGFSVLGRLPGTVMLTFTAPGIDTVTYPFTVTSPALVLGTFASPGSVEPDSNLYSTYASTTDGFSVARPPADTLVAVLRSTDPSVLLVTDSLVRFTPSSYGSSYGGGYRPIAPGTARLYLSAPGYVADTSALITVRPLRLDVPNATLTMGRGAEYQVFVTRQMPRGAATPFTVTVRGPSGVTVAAPSDTFAIGTSGTYVTLRSRAPGGLGTDTLIFQAPGVQPDTLLMTVMTATAFPIVNYSGLVGQDLEVGAQVRILGYGSGYAFADSTTLVVQAIDTAMIAVIDDTIRVAASESSPYQLGLVRFRRPGTGRIRLIDPTGRLAPDSVALYGYAQTLSGSQNRIFLSMGQTAQTDGAYYVYRGYSSPDSLWVRFKSSAEAIVPAPDSVLMLPFENYAYFDLAAGDSIGSARLSAEASGYLPQEFEVFVTRGLTQVYTGSEYIGLGSRTRVDAYVVNAVTLDAAPVSTALPLRLWSQDPTIARVGADSLFVIPAGSYWADTVGPVVGAGLGRTDLILEDPRSGSFQRLLSGRTSIEVQPARLSASARILTATVGLASSQFDQYVGPADGADSLWIQLRSVGGRVTFDADSVLANPQVGGYGYFAMTGVSVGVDTIVFSAPGYPADTVLANVTAGRLFSYALPPTLGVNDSTDVTLYFQSSAGGSLPLAEASRTMTITVSGGVQASDPTTGTPISSITASNGSYSFTFRLKATAPGGGELTVTGPGLTSFRRVFNTITRPD